MAPAWKQEIETALIPGFTRLAERMVTGSRALCPVDTRKLQDSVQAVVDNHAVITLSARAENAQGKDYARAVEEGHDIYNQYGGPYGHVDQRPFLRPMIHRWWGELR